MQTHGIRSSCRAGSRGSMRNFTRLHHLQPTHGAHLLAASQLNYAVLLLSRLLYAMCNIYSRGPVSAVPSLFGGMPSGRLHRLQAVAVPKSPWHGCTSLFKLQISIRLAVVTCCDTPMHMDTMDRDDHDNRIYRVLQVPAVGSSCFKLSRTRVWASPGPHRQRNS